MLRSFFFTTFLVILFAGLFGDSSEGKASSKLKSGHLKDAIANYQKLLLTAPENKKGEYLKQLAIAYYRDQEHGKAFETYLAALQDTPKPAKETPMSDQEKLVYEEGLHIYLDPKERDTEAVAHKIRDLYAGLWRLHPDYHHLGYLVAVSDANLGNFDDFFEIFYSSYQALPDHFLAYKTKAILHIKLYERARTVEEKDRERRAILAELELAKKQYSQDPSIYRLQIVFSPESDKLKVVDRNLNEIIRNNIIIPRSDLAYYFDELLGHGQIELAKQFLTKAREWYPYSRTLDAAKAIIEEKTKSKD